MMARELNYILLALSWIAAVQSAVPVFRQIWSEEFLPCNSSACVNGLNSSVWSFEQGDGTKYGPYLAGWGNNEAQCYTDRPQNARALASGYGVRGVLVLEAQFETSGFPCVNPGAATSTRWWTSARLSSRGKVAFVPDDVPIKIEARVRTPTEWGPWAAFWMLPDTPRQDCIACGDYGNGWCSSGEIDILETRNRDGMFRSVVHYGGLRDQHWLDCYQAMADFDASANKPSSYWTRVSAVWGPANISFYVNDTLTHSVSQSQWFTGGADKATQPRAPFDRPFYLLLNLAVGGNFVTAQTAGALITDTRRAPYRFLVDWIRVYKQVA